MAVSAKKTANGPRIAIVGITGAVGQEFLTVRTRMRLVLRSVGVQALALFGLPVLTVHLQVLKERNFPYSNIKMLASARCAVMAIL